MLYKSEKEINISMISTSFLVPLLVLFGWFQIKNTTQIDTFISKWITSTYGSTHAPLVKANAYQGESHQWAGSLNHHNYNTNCEQP